MWSLKKSDSGNATATAPALEQPETTVESTALIPSQVSTVNAEKNESPLYIATGGREKKLKDDLNRRSLKEAALGRSMPATTIDMRFYDFIQETTHNGVYQDGETITIGEISLELYGRTRSDSEQRKRDKSIKTAIPCIIGAYNERNHGHETLVPVTDNKSRIIGIKVPATAADRDKYLNKINHMKALATGKVVGAEKAFAALPSSNPCKLLVTTTQNYTVVEVEVQKQLTE